MNCVLVDLELTAVVCRMVPGVIRVIPSTCITFLVYEKARKTIGSILEGPGAHTAVKWAV